MSTTPTKLAFGLLACVAAVAPAQNPRPSRACQTAFETVNWVREKLAEPNPTPARLEQLLAAMELRSGSCPTIGDLWYYRSEVERQLKRPKADIDYSQN